MSAEFGNSTTLRWIRIENHRSLAFVEAHAEMLEHVQPPKQVKTDSEMGRKTHSGLDAMWANLQLNTVQKNGDQAPIAYFDQDSLALLKFKSDIPCEIAMNDGISGAGIHVCINPLP